MCLDAAHLGAANIQPCPGCNTFHVHVHAGLDLQRCSFPVVALPLLRNPMLALRDLYLDFEFVEGSTVNGTLQPLLLALLCRSPTGVTPLERLTVIGCPSTLDAAQCMQSVTEQLEVCFGLTGVELSLQCISG